MSWLPGIPLDFRRRRGRLFLSLSVVLFIFAACFSGESERQTARKKLSEDSGRTDIFRLSQITVPHDAAFSAVLSDLSRNDLQNIDRAILLFNSNKADSLSRDSMLVTFNEFMSAVIQEYNASNLTGNRRVMDQFENKMDQSEAKKMTESLAAHGVSISFREGEFYLEPNLPFVYDRLESQLTNSSRNYLKIKISLASLNSGDTEQKLSPPDSLAYQIITWEDFIRQNPEFILEEEILAQYIDVLAAYLSGLEQLPLFDPETKLLTPEYKASYLRYMEKYPAMESTGTVKKFYNLLESNGFKYDESMDTFLSEVNFIPSQNPQ